MHDFPLGVRTDTADIAAAQNHRLHPDLPPNWIIPIGVRDASTSGTDKIGFAVHIAKIHVNRNRVN